jgi:subtilisin-like proprotein convertase family protein
VCQAGSGIGIRINDSGVDSSHPELSANFDIAGSCSVFTPAELNDKEGHGTFCASLAAATGNSECSVGIAPNARISGCRIVAASPDAEIATELTDHSFLYKNMETMDISSNSWGIRACSERSRRGLQSICPFVLTSPDSPCSSSSSACSSVDWSNPTASYDCEHKIISYCRDFYEQDALACSNFLDLFVQCSFNSLNPGEQDSLSRGITKGRRGKGLIYLFASGNGYEEGSDVNFAGYTNNRYVISVGSVGKNGLHASYSTPGSALFVTAPGGDFESYTNTIGALIGGGCAEFGVGTSFSVPIMAGVIALVLEANPNLTWRDVQGILATTSQMIDSTDSTWTVNAGGMHHSYLYGFGLADAAAAVKAAKSWTLFANETQIIAESGALNQSIPDYPAAPVVSTVNIEASDRYVSETVSVYLDLSHSSRGDLQINLTSPSGTESILQPGKRPENSQYDERWKLTTVRSWGESPKGVWTLSIADQKSGDIKSCVDLLGWTSTWNESLCAEFEILGGCSAGGIGPEFKTVFPNVTGLSDPALADSAGVTPDVACCACGGGESASLVKDIFRSWRLAVYGREENSNQTSTPPSNASGQANSTTQTPSATTGSSSTPTGPVQSTVSKSDSPTPGGVSTTMPSAELPTPSPTMRPTFPTPQYGDAPSSRGTRSPSTLTSASPRSLLAVKLKYSVMLIMLFV